jgi:hypothetical protein
VLITRRSAALAALLPPKGIFGYDVIAYIGLARFIEHRQREEIRAALKKQYGIDLSLGEISVLIRRFLAYLEALHTGHSAEIQAALHKDGGWPMHIDATGEDGRGTLFVVLAGWRHWVLGAWKIPTERSDVILPRLRSVIERFGAPCGIVRDLGRAMKEACDKLVSELHLDIPILACHLHFLADVGDDLLSDAHDKLRGLFRRFKVRSGLRAFCRDLGRTLGKEIADARQGVSDWQVRLEEGHVLPEGKAGLATVRALAQWVLDYHADGNNQGFPFELPYLDLYNRCCVVCRAVDAFHRRATADAQVNKALDRLRRILHPVGSQVPFGKVTATLRYRDELFTELREALRLRPKQSTSKKHSTTSAPSTQQVLTELRDVESAVRKLTDSLARRRPERGPAQNRRDAIDIVRVHLKRHGEYLFGHIIQLPPSAGGDIRVIERTNNDLEGFFHGIKQGERKRSGRKVLTQDFEQLPANAVYAENLRHDDYVAIVCGSLDKLPEAFARLDASSRSRSSVSRNQQGDADIVSASLPLDDRKIVRTEEMKRRIYAAANSRAPRL